MNKSTEPKVRKTIFICAILVLTGGAMTASGIVKIITFLQNIPQHETLTTNQILRELILPHMMLLFGMGLLGWGFILLVRQAIIQSRLKHGLL